MTLRIITLSEDSILAQYGAQDGDYIHRVNDHEISSRDELRLVYTIPTVEFEIKRGSKSFKIQVSTEEPGATVEDSEGEFFALLPQSTLDNISAAPKPQSARWTDEPQTPRPKLVLHEESDAEKGIMLVAWTFLFINVIGGIFLIAQFGSEMVPGGREKVWNVELIALVSVACLSSVFLVAFAAMLCHYKRHLTNIDRALMKLLENRNV